MIQGPSAPAEPDPGALPADAGQGRRIFSEAEQRVWLVRANDTVRRTCLVSGSLVGNLDPGRCSVFSTSRWAVGVDDSGVMEFFVRFAHGEQAAIGFHTIPTKLGTALQSRAQLGSPQSRGCIRQATADAISLWRFAPEGTTIVVVRGLLPPPTICRRAGGLAMVSGWHTPPRPSLPPARSPSASR